MPKYFALQNANKKWTPVGAFVLGFIAAIVLLSSSHPTNFVQNGVHQTTTHIESAQVKEAAVEKSAEEQTVAVETVSTPEKVVEKGAATCEPIKTIQPGLQVQEHITYEWRGKQYNEDVMNFPRDHIPHILQSEKMTTGAELGVLHGTFASHTLTHWKDCTTYYAVDLWAQQENYKDLANQDNNVQNANYQITVAALKPWETKVKILRMKTVEGAAKIPDESLDYVYVDARHDYCGALEDIEAYWPKLRACGILAGHDYLDAKDPELLKTNQDWSLCMNGTTHNGAVKGAVRDFAASRGLTIYTTNEFSWRTWMIRKE